MPNGGADSSQRCGRGLTFERRCKLLQQHFGVDGGHGSAQPFLQPRHCLGKARGIHWFHEIVEHALRKGLHSVLIVSRDKDKMRAVTDVACRLDAGYAWHMYIEKTNIGMMRIKLIDSLSAIARQRHHSELRPYERQLLFERLAQQRFVLGNQGGWPVCC